MATNAKITFAHNEDLTKVITFVISLNILLKTFVSSC